MVKARYPSVIFLLIISLSTSLHSEDDPKRFDLSTATGLGDFLGHLNMHLLIWEPILQGMDSRKLEVKYKAAKLLDDRKEFCVSDMESTRKQIRRVRERPSLFNEVFLFVDIVDLTHCIEFLEDRYIAPLGVDTLQDRKQTFQWAEALTPIVKQLRKIRRHYADFLFIRLSEVED